MPGKHDSFQRSVGQIYGENGSLVPVSRVSVPYSSEGVGKCRENATPSEGVQGRSTEKIALERFLAGGLGIFWQTGIRNNYVKYKYRRLRTTLLFLR